VYKYKFFETADARRAGAELRGSGVVHVRSDGCRFSHSV